MACFCLLSSMAVSATTEQIACGAMLAGSCEEFAGIWAACDVCAGAARAVAGGGCAGGPHDGSAFEVTGDVTTSVDVGMHAPSPPVPWVHLVVA